MLKKLSVYINKLLYKRWVKLTHTLFDDPDDRAINLLAEGAAAAEVALFADGLLLDNITIVPDEIEGYHISTVPVGEICDV